MDVVTIIMCSVLLVAVIVLIVIVLRKSKEPSNNQPSETSLKELGALSHQIDQLSKDMKTNVELVVAKEMSKLNEQTIKNNETHNEKLERFQRNIQESLETRFDAVKKQIDDKLIEINKKVDEKLTEGFKGTTETITQVRERLQAIDAAQKNIEDLSKDVVSLKNVLEGNQSRGQYGEYQLSMVLHNVFGDTIGCYEEQYTMKKVKDGDDVRADAVVFMPEPNKMICIDSKFPFADYQRMFDAESAEEKEKAKKEFASAVKKHITVIKDKYIVEGKTAPEALMFIPNDGVFAFVHHELQDVVDYAREKKVILTSPSTLPAILVTINMVKIEAERAKNVHEISKQLNKLGKDFEMFAREWDQFSNQLALASKTREKLDSRVDKISTKFESISSSNPMLEDKSDEENN